MTESAAPTAATEPAPPWQLRFFTIWLGQAVSLLGSQLVQFALIWYLTTTTNSGTTLAIASLMGLLPQVLLSPLIGTLVDRWNRRAIMIAADATVAAATVVLALLFAGGSVAIWHIYALLFVRAVGSGFHSSAMGASTVLLVPRQHLARVQGINQALLGGLNIVAAPLGALLLNSLAMLGILLIDIATAMVAITPLLFWSIPQPQRTEAGPRGSIWQEMRAGLSYVLGWPGLLIVLAMAMLINFLLTPAGALLPLLVTRHFGGQALQLAWLEAALGGGIIIGGLLLGVWGGFRRRIVTALCGLAGLGAGVLIVGSAPPEAIWLALAGNFVLGIMQPITNGSFGAVIQAAVAPEMQGRVFALILSAASLMSPLALLIAGPLSDVLDVRAWYWAGGVACILLALLGFMLPSVMNIERTEADGVTATL